MFAQLSMPLAIVPEFVHNHLGWFAFGAIVLIGLVLFGMQDLLRFSWGRVWAISGVCFDESIRRRVLWITPLAILGVIVVSQLQKPFDELDAIRQTIKFCLFTTGLVVVITTIILACTNLPREIENRVIYTVVTKPTTRLEIVLGKVVGFARVSATILLIMGLFTVVYLRIRAWGMEREIAQRLENKQVPEASRATLAHYRDAGLLQSKALTDASLMQMYGKLPDEQGRRWMIGEGEGDFVVPFVIPDGAMGGTPGSQTDPPGAAGALLAIHIGYEQGSTAAEKKAETPTTTTAGPTTEPWPFMVPWIVPPEERGKTKKSERPTLAVVILNENFNTIGSAVAVTGGGISDKKEIPLGDPTGKNRVLAFIPPDVAGQMSLHKRVWVQVLCATPNTRLFVEKHPMIMQTPGNGGQPLTVEPLKEGEVDQTLVMFRGRSGSVGNQLRGDPDLSKAPVAIYSFRKASVSAADGTKVPFQFRIGIERSGDYDETNDSPTEMTVLVRNAKTGQTSTPQRITPESGRPVFFDVASETVAGGDFDVQLQNMTRGHYAGLRSGSLSLVGGRQMFELNLFKSLLILWLMSVLVTAVAIFTSTFLSWPIAVVLTLVILLGHWGVNQISDSLGSEMGNQVATDLFGAGSGQAAKAKVVSSGVNALATALKAFATILPDIGQYPATEDIERGITIPAAKLQSAAMVTFGFGIPLVVLAYVLLRNKEVAP